jgi:putative oxygen-independent coproporphyrinogen III oxidase
MNAETIIDRVAAARSSLGAKDLQIYIHIPFCSSKCHFCDWVDDIPVTQLKSGPAVRQKYVHALCRQIEYWGPPLTALEYRPKYIYWGGGTPTRLDAEDFKTIHRSLSSAFDLSSVSQHTMESTPSDITEEKLVAIESIGVDRLSFGVQSFDPDQLRRAGRAHSREQAIQAVELTRKSKIKDVNIDLISGFPDESLAAFKKTLEVAAELAPTHISVYSYRATPRTMMAIQVNRGVRNGLKLDEMIESYELAQDVLTRAGYKEYCFNYFKKQDAFTFDAGLYGYQLDGDIMGFGAGATSTIGGLSLSNQDTQLHRYMDNPLEFDSINPFSLDKPEMFFPLLGGALMTQDGLSLQKFEYITGVPFSMAWQTPQIKAWFQYVQNCGARLNFEKNRILSADRNIHRVYLRNLSYTLNPTLLQLA